RCRGQSKRRDSDLVSYHVMQLDGAGFIVAQKLGGMNSFKWEPKYLTYQGHEFLETIRDGEVWSLTKKGADKVGSSSHSLVLELGKAYGKQVLKDRLGIDLQ
ncbi:DUF2513 domain-containing protein, partial [Pseudomonas sp. TNT2022 ID357]